MTLRWPCEVLRPQNVAFNISPRTLAGPTSISGITQVVSSDAGIWKATYGNVIVKSRDAVITHRALSAILEGRLTPILVPLCRAYQPLPTEDGLFDVVPHDDDAYFDDDTGYVGGSISVLAPTMAARATSAIVTIEYGGTIQPGMHFSIGERLYRLRQVSYIDATSASILFSPPLREAVAAGTFMDFDDPVCRMRLAEDSQMDLELAFRRYGTPTVQFVEDV